MSYDPRTDTGIPTEPVGSLPRPSSLQAAYAEYDAGNISKDDLGKEQDALHWFRTALRKDPRHRPTHEALAAFYARAGAFEQAAYHRRFLRNAE